MLLIVLPLSATGKSHLGNLGLNRGASQRDCPSKLNAMRDILLTLTIFGSVPLILVKPHIGVLVFSWISYMNPHRLTWGFAYNFQFAFLIAATTILAWAISREPKRLPWNGVTLLLIAFTLWVSFTTLFALYPDEAYIKWERTAKILLFNGFITLALMGTKERLNALVWVIVLSIGFFGAKGGVFTLLGGGTAHVFGPAGSFIQDNNDLGLALVTVIPLMRYLQLASPHRTVRWGLGGLIALSFIAILGTYSRGALVGTAVLVVALVLKSRRRVMMVAGIAVVLVLGIGLMPQYWHTRMGTIASEEVDASVQGRLDAWGYAIDLALERPITGGGFRAVEGYVNPNSGVARSAHSIYFEVLGEHGFVGLALYLALGIGTFFTGSWILRHAKGDPDLVWARDLASMLQVSLTAFAVAGLFLGLAFFDLFYHLVAIMILTDAVVRQTLSASVKQDEKTDCRDRLDATLRDPG